MTSNCRNVYKSCRIAAGLTQEQAAECLYISVRKLSDYENGHDTPPDDLVERMSVLYDAPKLAWFHVITKNPLGSKILPKLHFTSFSTNVIKLQKALRQLHQMEDDILAIASDGRIDLEEESQWQKICEILHQCAGAIIACTLHKPSEVEECQALF